MSIVATIGSTAVHEMCVRHPSRNPSPPHVFQTSLPTINGPIDGPSESFALIHHSFSDELLHLSHEVLVNVFK